MNWPTGMRSAGVSCGIKSSGAPDLGVLVFDSPAEWAGTFTRNAAAAAPVGWCREHIGAQVSALVVNSGNANACTGVAGREAVAVTATAAAESAGCEPDQVLVASTGPIGIPLPIERIVTALPNAVAAASSSVEGFTAAIKTTDTRIKTAAHPAGDATVVGVAKGAAMIAPNMATMLAFIATDASAGEETLDAHLSRAVDRTFNRISIDACESTNDSVFLFSTNTAGRAGAAELGKAVEAVCADLAEQIVRDAEGGTKFVRIRVVGAPSDAAAVEAGKAVAASALWRAAVAGGDPNWGRVLSALGSSDRALDLSHMTLAIGDVVLFDGGEPTGGTSAAAKEMSASEITVECSVGQGSGTAEVLSADLTIDYVKLNSEGTT